MGRLRRRESRGRRTVGGLLFEGLAVDERVNRDTIMSVS